MVPSPWPCLLFYPRSLSDPTKAHRFKYHLYWCLPHISPGLISPKVQIQHPTAFLIHLYDCLIGTSNLYLKLSSLSSPPVFPISLNNFILLPRTNNLESCLPVLVFLLPTSNFSANLVGFTFKIYPASKHFSPPLLKPSWSKSFHHLAPVHCNKDLNRSSCYNSHLLRVYLQHSSCFFVF